MVSVIVPCYNCEKTLDRCVESIRNQTQPKLEIVLVDDGSQDRTGEHCDRVAELDSRIRVIHQENKGLLNAWKQGVSVAEGEYIAFCDSDDYIDHDMIEVLEKKALQYHADIVFAGMIREWPDKTTDYADNRLVEGYYFRMDIEKKILPEYFSNGRMESRIILASRDTKLFRKSLLLKNFQYLNDNISFGEDVLTTFVTILSAESVYCFNNFYPYHYMKNQESMIGKYDENMFQKCLDLREQLRFIADLFHYTYLNQIDMDFYSSLLLCMKKEITRNENMGCQGVCKRLRHMRENKVADGIISQCSIDQFDLKSRIFAWLIVKKQYLLVYFMTKAADLLKISKN